MIGHIALVLPYQAKICTHFQREIQKCKKKLVRDVSTELVECFMALDNLNLDKLAYDGKVLGWNSP